MKQNISSAASCEWPRAVTLKKPKSEKKHGVLGVNTMGLHVVSSSNSRAWVGNLMDKVDSLTDMIGSLMCCAPPFSTFGDYYAVLGMIRLLNSAVIERVLRPSTHSIILTYGIGEGSPLSVRTSRAMPSPTSLAHDSVRSVEHPMIVEITGFCIVLVQKTCVSNGVSIQL